MHLDQATSIQQAFFDCARNYPEKKLFSQSVVVPGQGDSPRPRKEWSFPQVADQVKNLACFLSRSGFLPGSRAAIISNSRPEWLIADLAILAAGGVVVAVYQSLTPIEVGYLLYDSGADFVFVENQEQIDKLLGLINSDFEVAATEERPALKTRLKLKSIICFEQFDANPLVIPLSEASREHVSVKNFMITPGKRDDLATIVYTSGTSGPPKGVMQTHGNHLANLRQAFQAGMYSSESSIMLFLPLAHSFARLMGYIGCIAGATVNFPATTDRRSSRMDQQSVTRDIAEANATVVPLVPRILEKMKQGIERHATESGPGAFFIKKLLFSARVMQECRQNQEKPPREVFLWYMLTLPMRKLIKKKLFGARFINAISGGARLSEEVNLFFDALGIVVLQGYGLTETSVATNVNRINNNRIGTVGPVLSPDIEIKIAADGEIMFRGPNVAIGYLNREQATRAAWDDQGWFRTGDLGAIDSEGRLTITGRKKELIVTAGGKKIAPEPIEEKIKSNSIFSQAVLVGEAKPYCCVVVTLNPGALIDFAELHSIDVTTPYSTDAGVAQIVAGEIKRINRELASFESIKKFLILDQDFTVENGFMTPTLKVKRTLVIKTYSQQIEMLYLEER